MLPSTIIFGFFVPGIGPTEMVIFGTIALVLFGKKLPEVAKSVGKGIVEFKKGMQGIQDELHGTSSRSTSYSSASSTPSYSSPSRPVPADDRAEITAPKFEPPKFEPQSTDNA